MSVIPHFANYVAAFEQAYASDDWSLVAPLSTDDAVNEAKLPEPPGDRFEGHAAILAHFGVDVRLRALRGQSALAATKIAPGRHAIAHQTLQRCGLGETPGLLAREDQLVADAYFEDAAAIGCQRYAREFLLEGRQRLLREPCRAQQPPALGAVGDRDCRGARHCGNVSRSSIAATPNV